MNKILTCGFAAFFALSVHASDTTKTNLKGTTKVKTVEIEVDNDRTMVLRGPVMDDNMEALTTQFRGFIKDGNENVYLIIDTPGGSVVDGLKFINIMKAAKKKFGIKTICIIENQAYSMGALIMSYCHETYMLKYASLMFHEAAYGLRGMRYHIKKRVDFTEEYLDLVNRDVAKQLNMSFDEYIKFQELESWWTSESAAKHGLINGVLDSFYYDAEPPAQNPMRFLFGQKDANIYKHPLTEALEESLKE